MAWNREEFVAALRKRIGEKARMSRYKDNVGEVPVKAIDPFIDIAAEVAHRFLTPEPTERTDEEVIELIKVGNKMATKLMQLTRSRRAAGTEYTEVRRLCREWDALLDEDDDDDDDEPVSLTAHPRLRVKDWEQIWSVMSGGQIKDYDGFTDVGVEQTMTVEEFMERVVKCTVQLGKYRGGRP